MSVTVFPFGVLRSLDRVFVPHRESGIDMSCHAVRPVEIHTNQDIFGNILYLCESPPELHIYPDLESVFETSLSLSDLKFTQTKP